MLIFSHCCSKNRQFSMNFHDNSKNEIRKNRKIVFSFVSAHCASFMKVGSKLRGEDLLVVTWDRAKTSADIFIDYCGIMQNFEKQCGGIFTVDIYLKIFEDNVLNSFDTYFFYLFFRLFVDFGFSAV